MSKIFEEAKLKHLTLKNRLVRSATQDPFGGIDGKVTAAQKELYRTLASNEIGMIITAHVCVRPEGRAGAVQNCFYDDSFVEGQREVAAIIKENGAAAILQLSHAGGSAAVDLLGEDAAALAPVEKVFTRDGRPSKAMTEADMEYVKTGFAEAAKRAAAAGFDGVQLHLAHSYLLSQFIDPAINNREDAYGKDAEGRFRFPKAVVAAVREAVGPDYPIFIKINSNTSADDTAYEADLLYMLKELEPYGLEGIELSGFNFTPLGREGKRNYYLERASRMAKAISTPVFLVGGVRSLADMEQALDGGMALVSMSRPFICEPELGTKLKTTGEDAKCISCSKCFLLYGREKRRCVQHPLPEAL